MPELLTHVLAAYVLATALSFHYDWLSPKYVTVAMVGAIVPDLSRMDLLVSDDWISAFFGIPFDWSGVHTLGGSLVVCAIGALLVGSRYRKPVFALLVLGMLSHLVLDGLLLNPSGYSYAIFWPLTSYHPPTPGLYLSSDRWPALVSAIAAAVVWYLRYGRH